MGLRVRGEDSVGAVATPRQFRLRLLSGFRLEFGEVVLHPSPGCQRLLAYLAVHGVASRAVLAGVLWPDVSEEHAHGSLRTTIWRLRRYAGDLLDIGRQQLSLARSVWVDVQALTARARRLLRPDAVVTREDLELSGLHGGELLPGWYDDWVLFERERLRQLRIHALESLSRRLLRERRAAEALDAALEAVRLEPLRESGHRCVLAAHLAEGNVVEALRHYEVVRLQFAAELGVAPSRALTTLMANALRSYRPAHPHGTR
ncbi:AfsR/SARP family transcriptional regulator [Streptoalloteichus hindustanus]|uniref:DNA-binding transcriptional activator of the SARP family n=1 Tax=Streptoalloteichus hindustanus TaxID=2017 RepID=A0A1M5P4B4_STRHI|nr:BTAD domain-containing putative transcriptional regulator [Streptoalloteichus hindustanus]SHG96630.1 DNA-binding transcriptional activator of the SARP family [Streptoalloteichus hindustanus]